MESGARRGLPGAGVAGAARAARRPDPILVGHVDGEPAATALSHTAHGLVSVEAVATLPDHRGRGLGAAATWAATLAQPELPAVLTASDEGIGVYRRMGYLPVVRWTMWFRS